jgi:hypothetical protein
MLDGRSRPIRAHADFNGLFGDILCLSHGDDIVTDTGETVRLAPGMSLTAYDEDLDENGKPDALIASGIVEPSPRRLRCLGSRWVLRIDKNGVRHQSDLPSDTSE